MGRLLQLRYALRQLAKVPSFATTALLTLALGIGANVVVFGLLNALLLRPLDVPEPAGLYKLAHTRQDDGNQPYPDYPDFKTRNHTFRDVAAYRLGDAGLSTGTVTCKCWFYKVSGSYFDPLGARGRMLHATEEHGANSAPASPSPGPRSPFG